MAFLSSFYPQPVVKGTTAGTFAEGNDPRFGDGLAEAPEDGIIYGRKDADWVDITEPANLQIRRGTEAEVAAITPLEGEPVWETDTKKLVVGDGATAGGITVGKFPLDGTPTNLSAPSLPKAGSIFIAKEVEALGGTFLGGPFVAGNARGRGAVDLQGERTAATQVASGEYSFIAGSSRCTASATNSVILTSTASTVSGPESCLLGGSSNTVSGARAFGFRSNITSEFGVSFNGTSDRFGMFAHGSKGSITGFGVSERAQAVQIIVKGRTTNATPAGLFVTLTTPISITENTALFGQIEICAIEETNATEAAHYIRKFAIQNLAGTTTLIGSVTTIGTDEESDAGYDVSITADDSTNSLSILVTGDSSKTLRWVGVLRGTEIEIS